MIATLDWPSLLVGAAGMALVLGLLLARQYRQSLRMQQTQQQLQLEADEQRDIVIRQQLEQVRLQEQLVAASRLEERLDEAEEEVRGLQQANSALQSELRGAQVRLDEERSHHQQQLASQEQARSQLRTEFQQLAQRIFEDSGQRFGAQQQEKMDALLRPLRDQLGEFRRRVDDVYDKEAKDRRGLQEQLQQLKQLNLQMSEDALNLTRALKGENKTQGNWGEVVLERVLEDSGLRRGHEYQVQVSGRDSKGRLLQPDVIVHLPEGKDVVIDAKVNLVAYERYVTAADNTQAAVALREHLQALRRQIKSLSGKPYAHMEGVRSLDLVLLFIPIEAAFLLAMEEDSALFADAFAANILLVSPSTLLVTLKTIHHIWRNEKQNRNALEIARQGGELVDKFVGFVEALDEIGRHLNAAQRAYSTAHRRLSSGRGSLVSRVEGLNAMGVRARKELPAAYRDQLADDGVSLAKPDRGDA